jgi:hypothetical protein
MLQYDLFVRGVGMLMCPMITESQSNLDCILHDGV